MVPIFDVRIYQGLGWGLPLQEALEGIPSYVPAIFEMLLHWRCFEMLLLSSDLACRGIVKSKDLERPC